VRIVTAHAISRGERLVLVRLLQIGALHVVAINTECRWRLGEMEVKLDFPHLSRLMRRVAGIAAHIEGRMPAAFLGNVQPGLVAAQAEVFLCIP